jgi:hypothetical protein
MIGLSLSFCVQQIIAGEVNIDDVDKIVAGTRAPNSEEWDNILRRYRDHYWTSNPEEGERVARQLIASGKVEQPRVTEGRSPNISNLKIWVDSESEIVWER